MNSIEITASFGLCLLAMAVAAYLLHRQCVTIDQQARALDIYKRALDAERAGHAKAIERLARCQAMSKEAIL